MLNLTNIEGNNYNAKQNTIVSGVRARHFQTSASMFCIVFFVKKNLFKNPNFPA